MRSNFPGNGLAQLAGTLGRKDVQAILETTLEEEKKADEMLTAIAEKHIN
jgi:ferritin-like metal-binding protein YciE